jgi:xanthine dehydrogenase YagS FAD-binding subunit
MNAFGYVNARTPEAAVEAVRDDGRFLAGGLDLLGELKESIVTPKTLVNIKTLPNSAEVRHDGNTWSIGANATLAMIAAHIDLRRACAAVAEAAAEVGSPQIRNVATLGGNLAQHSRCWYYRHRDVHCRKKGGSTCFARAGESKYHSLFTGSMCLSPCTSNLAIALAACEARVFVLRGRRTERLTIADLYADAWRTPSAHNSLRPDDLIVRVELTAADRRSTYLQVAEKSDFDWALVSCAVAAKVEGTTLRQPRIVLGSVAPIPWLVPEANTFLDGKTVTREVADRAAELVLREARPAGDNAYKLPIAKALIRRALLKLVAAA